MSAFWLVLSFYLPLWVLLGMSVIPAAIPATNPMTTRPLSWFKVKRNSRKRFDQESLRALGKELRVRQIAPLVCLPDGTIICGERRYRAAVMERLTELNVAIITDAITEAEFDRFQLVENLHRTDLSNSEKCEGCVQFARNHPEMTLKQIGEELHVDPSMVTRWLAWEKCIAAVQQALTEDTITLQRMYKLSQLPHDEQAAEMSGKHNGVNGSSNGTCRNKLPLPGMEFSLSAKEPTLSALKDGLRSLLQLADEASDLDVLTEALKVAKTEGVTDLDVVCKALREAREANDPDVDIRTLLTVATVAKVRKGKKKGE
jgi:ParB/RepB/Spo0J family partition protein